MIANRIDEQASQLPLALFPPGFLPTSTRGSFDGLSLSLDLLFTLSQGLLAPRRLLRLFGLLLRFLRRGGIIVQLSEIAMK